MIRPAVTEIVYVGDLDAAGIKIAADLQRTSRAVPGPPRLSFILLNAGKLLLALRCRTCWLLGGTADQRCTRTRGFLSPDVRQRW